MNEQNEWQTKYIEAIKWVEDYFAKKYTPEQIKYIGGLIRHEIPPKRLLKVFQHTCKILKRHTLPLANDFLDADKLTPYSQMAIENVGKCNCFNGIIFYYYINAERDLNKLYSGIGHGYCECRNGRAKMANINAETLKHYLMNCGIEWSGNINPEDHFIRSAKYKDRILRLTTKKNFIEKNGVKYYHKEILEINYDNWLPLEPPFQKEGNY